MARALGAQPYLTLDRYRQLMNIPLCAFNGVENPNESVTGCDGVWAQWQREMLAQALADAEGMLASRLRFQLGARFLTDVGHSWQNPISLNWGWIVGAGIEALTEVTPSASDFTVDPATITVAQSDFPGGIDEIWIIDDESNLQIVPDKVTESGIDYIIEIDQCKLIEWDNLETQVDPIDYEAAFPAATWLKLADLTINRRYLDTTTQATVTFGSLCNCWYCGESCAETEQTGCVFIIDEVISKIRISLADYSDDTWNCAAPPFWTGCYQDDKVEVPYLAGTTDIPNWEQAVRRLAHTYIDFPPCGCAMFDLALQRDRRHSPVLTAERINNPLGISDGAWYAWTWLGLNEHMRAFML